MAIPQRARNNRFAAMRRRAQQGRVHTASLERRLAAANERIALLESQLASARGADALVSSARLNTLLAIIEALLVTHDIAVIRQLIVDEAPKLFPGSSGALLFLTDSTGQRLRLRAVSNGAVLSLVVQADQGVAGRAFQAPRALVLVRPDLDPLLAELEPSQIAELARLLPPWPPTSALLAPLRNESQRLGALVLYAGTETHRFSAQDLPFAQALADLTAVAIAETRSRARAAALQRDLAQTQSLHAEAQARLSAAQAQLLQSAKLAAVGELAASVAHEINNPLYAARNSLYLVAQDIPADSSLHAFLEIAQNELGRIARIITRMRDFYRPTKAELEPTDLNDLVLETIELVQTHLRHGSVTVITTLAEDLPYIIAHPDQLRQVVLNLLLNACDAMPKGGTIRVTTEATPTTAAQAALIILRVIDLGLGIAPEHLPHLFEPFYTTKAQGTGLGLAISAHIVTQHGGNITVESTLGAGATFTVTLPVPAATAEEEGSSAVQEYGLGDGA